MTIEVSSPVVPIPNKLTQAFWDGARVGQLIIQRCKECGHWQHEPEPICAACLSFNLGYQSVSGRGAIYTFCIPVQAFHPSLEDKLPYVLAVIELDEQPGLKVVSDIVDIDPAEVRVGDRVEVTFRPYAEGFVLPLFRISASQPNDL